MTISELIKELQKIPGDFTIYTYTPNGAPDDFTTHELYGVTGRDLTKRRVCLDFDDFPG